MYAKIQLQVKQIGDEFDWYTFKYYKDFEDIDLSLFRKTFGIFFEFRVVVETFDTAVVIGK